MDRIVLMYHDVFSERPGDSGFDSLGANHYKLSTSLFEQHLKILKATKNLECTLTFDDGGVSFYNTIAPLLEKYGFIGHFYFATKYIGQEGFCTEYQIQELYKRGHVIGSHSHSHPDNMNNMSVSEKKQEWEQSVLDLTRIIGARVTEVSIPNGYYNNNDIHILHNLGINTIYTSSPIDYKICEGIDIVGRFALNGNSTDAELEKLLRSRWYRALLCIKERILSLAKWFLGDTYLKIKSIIRRIECKDGNNK